MFGNNTYQYILSLILLCLVQWFVNPCISADENLIRREWIRSNADMKSSNFTCFRIDGNSDNDWYSFENTKFDDSDFSGAHIDGVTFTNCSFRNCRFNSTHWNSVDVPGCDFTDADIQGGSGIVLSAAQLKSTASYKNKNLSNTGFANIKNAKKNFVVFSNFDLRCSTFRCDLSGCSFDNAIISNSTFASNSLSKEQLTKTFDFKQKALIYVRFLQIDLSCVDFSKFNLTGCKFGNGAGLTNFTNVNFTDAVITDCNLNHIFISRFSPKSDIEATEKQNRTLTIEQIKSTWNYKTGNMRRVMLPKYIQDELDKEKKESSVKK